MEKWQLIIRQHMEDNCFGFNERVCHGTYLYTKRPSKDEVIERVKSYLHLKNTDALDSLFTNGIVYLEYGYIVTFYGIYE